jgi:hypothetical protein
LAGRIENWRLAGSDEVDNLRASPYYTKAANSPKFNKLFAALYDLMFSKLTNMGYLIPSPTRTLKEIFQEKIYGTDKFLVSAERFVLLMDIAILTQLEFQPKAQLVFQPDESEDMNKRHSM